MSYKDIIVELNMLSTHLGQLDDRPDRYAALCDLEGYVRVYQSLHRRLQSFPDSEETLAGLEKARTEMFLILNKIPRVHS